MNRRASSMLISQDEKGNYKKIVKKYFLGKIDRFINSADLEIDEIVEDESLDKVK